MSVTIITFIGALLLSVISSDFKLGLLLIVCGSPFVFLEIRGKIRDYQAQQYINWLFEKGREENKKKKGGVSDADN